MTSNKQMHKEGNVKSVERGGLGIPDYIPFPEYSGYERLYLRMYSMEQRLADISKSLSELDLPTINILTNIGISGVDAEDGFIIRNHTYNRDDLGYVKHPKSKHLNDVIDERIKYFLENNKDLENRISLLESTIDDVKTCLNQSENYIVKKFSEIDEKLKNIVSKLDKFEQVAKKNNIIGVLYGK